MQKDTRFSVTAFTLKILAMVFMVCDHLWATVIPGNDWLTCIGRIAFPIFAFLIVEGYSHTKNLKKYVLRLLIFALISEIPYNLMTFNSLFFPFQQNVLWTFLIGIGLIHWNQKAREKALWSRVLVGILSILVGYLAGLLTMVDYQHAGVLTVLAFYFFRGRNWWHYLGQILSLWYLNFEMLGGLSYEFSLFGTPILFPQQGFALLALIPIWLYRGNQGPHPKWLQYTWYAFYSAHMLILGLLAL